MLVNVFVLSHCIVASVPGSRVGGEAGNEANSETNTRSGWIVLSWPRIRLGLG